MRLVAWNCNMALHRKADALLSLRPDIAVISECAEPERLFRTGCSTWIENEPVWIGRHATKGLGGVSRSTVIGLVYPKAIGPTFVTSHRCTSDGPATFNLLAVWAQNASGAGSCESIS